MSILALSLLSTTALAQDSYATYSQDKPALDKTELSAPSTPPIYVSSRGGMAVPANANGDALSGGLGCGLMVDDFNSLGLRFIYMDDPPKNPLADYTPPIGWAWGPVIDWQHVFQPDSRVSFYSVVSLGYVYGTPDDPKENNVILPILEGGLGMRFSKHLSSGSELFLSPEIGFVPGAVAPYSAINMGILFPEKDG